MGNPNFEWNCFGELREVTSDSSMVYVTNVENAVMRMSKKNISNQHKLYKEKLKI